MSRQEFTPKTKLAAWERAGHHCEECSVLIRPGNGPEYDHRVEDYYDGGNSLDNCQVLCIGCHKAKTKQRSPVLAKSRRITKTTANARTKKQGFRKPPPGYKYNWTNQRYEKG